MMGRLFVLASAAALATALGVQEQQAAPAVRPSQHGSVSQQIAGTKITIEYNRPVARGRELFGALVPWGRVWCPGADTCTSIELSTDVKIDGQAFAAGSYSLWAEPDREHWTMIFNRSTPVFHTRYPAGQDALRIQVTPKTGRAHGNADLLLPCRGRQARRAGAALGDDDDPLSIDVP